MTAPLARDFEISRFHMRSRVQFKYSPPLTHGDQIPHPLLEDSDNQIPSSPGKRCQMPGGCLGAGGGGMLKLRFDRYITLVTDRGRRWAPDRGHVQMWSTVLYIRVLLDQFFTGPCSCTLAKILDVMIDSEMSFPEGEISSNSHVYKGKYLQLKCSVSMPEKIVIWLNRGREELVHNDDVSIGSRPQVKDSVDN